jgi:hypothetical protein
MQPTILTGFHQGQAIFACDDGAGYTLPGPDEEASGKPLRIYRSTGADQGQFLSVTIDDSGNLAWVDAQGRDCVMHPDEDGAHSSITCA